MEQVRQASPSKSWDKSLSDQHADIHAEISEVVKDISADELRDPLAVVGPYGSGKTQLLYKIFSLSWENGVPALYTDAKSIIEGFKASDDDSIVDWLTERVQNQVERLDDGKMVNWVPHFASQRRRQKWLDETVSGADIDSSKQAVLLVDEAEQAYTSLQQQVGVDDENALRELLDEVTGVYQVWSFGFVSAYEILGEADFRRFKELRIPLLDRKNVYDKLEAANKPTKFTNAIWWLARGRAGWVNKLVDEMPNDSNAIINWFSNQVSKYEFFDSNLVDLSILNEFDQQSQRDDAKRSLLFLADGHDDWTIDAQKYVDVKQTSDQLFEIIIESTGDDNIGFSTSQMIERSLDRVLRSLSTNRWQSSETVSDNEFLPATLFTEEQEFEALLRIIRFNITSFEPRGEDRDEAIELIREIDPSEIRSAWTLETPEIYEFEDRSVHTTRPSIIVEAYPSIAVDPSILSDYNTERLLKEQTEPIQIDPGIRTNHVDAEVKYCPTERAYQAGIQDVYESTNIPATTLLVLPDTSETDNWNTRVDISELEDFGKISIVERGSKRLRDFLLHFGNHLEKNNISDSIITEEYKDQAIDRVPDSNESKRQIIDTIDTLYRQVDRITTSEARQARDQFKKLYTIPGNEYPVWGDPDLEGESPFWHYPGRGGSISITGVTYAIAVWRGGIDGKEYTSLPAHLEDGYDQGFVHKRDFRFKQVLDLVFTSNGFGDRTETKRSEFTTDSGGLQPALQRLQELLYWISTESNKTNLSKLSQQLRSIDTDPDEISVWNESQFEYTQAPALLWGLLLDKLANDNPGDVIDRLQGQLDRIETMSAELEAAKREIELLNGKLSPPDEYGGAVQVNKTNIERFQTNLDNIRTDLDHLITEIDRSTIQATIGSVFNIIVNRYLEYTDVFFNKLEPIYSEELLVRTGELKNTFEQIMSIISEADQLTYDTSISSGELEEQLDIIAEDIFAFNDIMNTDEIELDDIKQLKDLADHTDDHLSTLSSLLQSLQDLRQQQERRIEETNELLDIAEDFLKEVTEEPASQQ